MKQQGERCRSRVVCECRQASKVTLTVKIKGRHSVTRIGSQNAVHSFILDVYCERLSSVRYQQRSPCCRYETNKKNPENLLKIFGGKSVTIERLNRWNHSQNEISPLFAISVNLNRKANNK